MQIELPESYNGMRIDKALSEHFGLSRNFFHNLFERKLIQVVCRDDLLGRPNQGIKKSYKIEGGETFCLPELERYADNDIMQESPNIELEIKHQTSDYCILYKPKGVLSHPKTLFDVKEPSVSGFLYHRFGHLPAMAGFIRAGIVHRLDKDTDGLMIVALSERGLQYFRELFDEKAKSIDSFHSGQDIVYSGQDIRRGEKISEDYMITGLRKHYRAICEITKKGERRIKAISLDLQTSCLPISSGSTLQPLRPSATSPYQGETRRDKAVVLDSLIYPKTNTVGYPKRGVTIVRGIERITNLPSGRFAPCHPPYQEGQSRVEIDLEIVTGRTHQIRYQLAEIGLPIVGDGLYGSTYGELGLTAYKLDFIDPDGERMVVEL